jgi:hypothetical protein
VWSGHSCPLPLILVLLFPSQPAGGGGGWPTLKKRLVLSASPNRGCPILARSLRKGGDHDSMGRLIGKSTQWVEGPAQAKLDGAPFRVGMGVSPRCNAAFDLPLILT